MLVRVALAAVALAVGGFQVVDGVHVLRTGRYIGPPTPGPWRHVVAAAGLDPFGIGPVFVGLGIAWLAAFGWLLLGGGAAAWWACVAVAVLTLWYLPVGTALTVVALVLLVLDRAALL
ncbi:MAG TPA: hypothetical protein VNA20_08520 [Frankiaceae bacterium]|nr:hypothetical protein [Frankiaceae bacterium]